MSERKYEVAGPWDAEPDEHDWNHKGLLSCAMRRGPSGHWCGYVAVPLSHPWHGKSYSEKVKAPKALMEREVNINSIGAVNAFCASIHVDEDLQAAAICMLIDVHGGLTHSGEDWPAKREGMWWFGFDCSHCDDLTPAMIQHYSNPDRPYRDFDYTKEQTEGLADQLVRIPSLLREHA